MEAPAWDQRSFRRVVLKLSGEAFADPETHFGIDAAVVQRIAEEIASAPELGVDIAVVVGGGNIWRGTMGDTRGMDRARSDYMGMLGTVINALALQDSLEAVGQAPACRPRSRWPRWPSRSSPAAGHPASREGPGRRVRRRDRQPVLHDRHHGRAARGRDGRRSDPEGHPLRCRRRLQCRSRLDPTAVKLSTVSYFEILNRGLKVMDSTAVTFCMDNGLPIVVFDVTAPGNILRALEGESIGTLVSSGAHD